MRLVVGLLDGVERMVLVVVVVVAVAGVVVLVLIVVDVVSMRRWRLLRRDGG